MKIQIRKATPPTKPTVGSLFAALTQPKEGPCITRLRGNARAELMLLMDHPEEDDFTNNVPGTGPLGSMYLQILAEAGFDIEKDLLLIPHSRFGAKPNKDSTRETLAFVQLVQEELPKKIVVCMGMTPFSHVFAGGRKTHWSSIIGNPMWIPSVKAYVYVLPGTEFLACDPDDFKTVKMRDKQVQSIFAHATKLHKFATSKGCRF